jgi:hypothetical protein
MKITDCMGKTHEIPDYEPKVLHLIEEGSVSEYIIPYRSIKCIRINDINPDTGLRTICVFCTDDERITGYVTSEQERTLRNFE